jgi:hypothetical protein
VREGSEKERENERENPLSIFYGHNTTESENASERESERGSVRDRE